jgi:hypothetical protein
MEKNKKTKKQIEKNKKKILKVIHPLVGGWRKWIDHSRDCNNLTCAR